MFKHAFLGLAILAFPLLAACSTEDGREEATSEGEVRVSINDRVYVASYKTAPPGSCCGI
jgi:hypothetical protein